jgi:hypothetical protein
MIELVGVGEKYVGIKWTQQTKRTDDFVKDGRCFEGGVP